MFESVTVGRGNDQTSSGLARHSFGSNNAEIRSGRLLLTMQIAERGCLDTPPSTECAKTQLHFQRVLKNKL